MYRYVSTCFNGVHSLLSPTSTNVWLSTQSVYTLVHAHSMTIIIGCDLWVPLVCNLIWKCFLLERHKKTLVDPPVHLLRAAWKLQFNVKSVSPQHSAFPFDLEMIRDVGKLFHVFWEKTLT